MEIAVLNKSKKVTEAEAAAMTAACSIQMISHIAPGWSRLPMAVNYYATDAAAPPGAFKIMIFDTADDPGALGYHTEDHDVIYGRIFVDPVMQSGGVVLFDPANPQNVSVASVLSHEVAELFADPFVNWWVDGPTLPEGSEYALEVADPVEGDSYEIDVNGTKVAVSNFVLPAWFDNQAVHGKFDYLGKLTAPFTMTSGGYMVLRSAPGASKQVFGEHYPAWRRETKKSVLSRTSRRKSSVLAV